MELKAELLAKKQILAVIMVLTLLLPNTIFAIETEGNDEDNYTEIVEPNDKQEDSDDVTYEEEEEDLNEEKDIDETEDSEENLPDDTQQDNDLDLENDNPTDADIPGKTNNLFEMANTDFMYFLSFDLQDAIDNADDNVPTEILIPSNLYLTGGEFLVKTSKDIILKADTEYSIYASSSRHFVVEDGGKLTIGENIILDGSAINTISGGILGETGSEVVLAGGTIQNCYQNIGSGIYMEKDSTLTITGGNIINNKADEYGAGLYVIMGDNSTVSITGLNCSYNTAKHSGAADLEYKDLDADGSHKEIVITDSTFSFNKTTADAAAIGVANITLRLGNNVKITDNYSIQGGTAITAGKFTKLYIEGEGIEISRNRTKGYMETTIIPGSTITIDNKDSILEIQGTAKSPVLFEDNTLDNNPVNREKHYGGVIYARIKSCNISYADFSRNEGHFAGAIACAGPLVLKNSTFEENYASSHGGAVIVMKGTHYEGKSEIDNCVFINNSSELPVGGGAFYGATDTNNTIRSSKFIDNTSPNGGAVLFAKDTTNLIENTEFYNNTAEFGGAIFLRENTRTDIKNTVFEENYAAEDGGAVFTGDYKILFTEEIKYQDNDAGNGSYVFDLFNHTDLKNTHKTNIIDTISLSFPYNVGDSEPEYTMSYNNFDINYTGSILYTGITYDPNEGAGSVVSTKMYDASKYTVKSSTDDGLGYNRAGYEFKGWSLTKDGNVDYAPGYVFDSLSGHIKLYAIWQKTSDTVQPDTEITIVKSVDKTSASLGDELIYNIIISNDRSKGAKSWSGNFTDELPAGTAYTGVGSVHIWNNINNVWEETNDSINFDTNLITVSGLTLTPGDKYQIQFSVTINRNFAGTSIINIASVTGTGTDSGKNYTTNEAVTDIIKKSPNSSGSGGYVTNKEKPVIEKEETSLKSYPQELNYDEHYAYIVGYPDGTVRPDAYMTRAEAVTVFFRLITDETRNAYYNKENAYSDINEAHWANTAVSTMSKMGIVTGYPDGSFTPDNNITRAEFTAMAAKFIKEDTVDNTFIFIDTDGHWAETVINKTAAMSWISGYGDNTFRPDEYIKRSEVMSIVNRVLNRIPENYNDLLENMIVWPDNIDKNTWYYIDIQEATNSHNFQRKDNGEYEYWINLRENRDWISLER